MIDLLEIVGQDQALTRLQRAMGSRHVPHAYVFAGPRGVGRRTTAQALAAALLCSRPAERPNEGRLADLPDDWPLRHACGACQDCNTLAASTHPDFNLIYKELARYHEDARVRDQVMQELSIHVIRQFLIRPAGRASTRGKGKVFVVLEADLLSDAAQDCLLKTLEEPPAGVRIILICRRPQQLLPTTLSRCWLVRFGPLPRDFVVERLRQAGVEERKAAFLAGFAVGSLGRAMELAERDFYENKLQVVERLAGLGPAGDAELADFLEGLMKDMARAAVKRVKEAQGADLSERLASRQATGTVLEMIAGAFRDALGIRTAAEAQPINCDQVEQVARIAERFDAPELAEIIQQLSLYERLLWRNVSPKIIWDNVVITCASAAPLRL